MWPFINNGLFSLLTLKQTGDKFFLFLVHHWSSILIVSNVKVPGLQKMSDVTNNSLSMTLLDG